MGNNHSACAEDDPILTEPINEDEFHVRLSHESIKDTYTLRKLIDARTVHGSIKISVKLAPLSTPKRTISTSTSHGSTVIDFLSSLGPSATALTSVHESHSSSITLDYPDDWRGTIEIQLQHGSYEFKTPDDYDDDERVRVLRDVKIRGYRTITAVKGKGVVANLNGEGQSVMRVKSSHGTIKVNFERKKLEGPALLPVAEGIPAGVTAEEVERIIPSLPGGGAAPPPSAPPARKQGEIVPPAQGSVQPPPYEESEASHAVTSDGTSTMSDGQRSPGVVPPPS